jgi:hypothetical protein
MLSFITCSALILFMSWMLFFCVEQQMDLLPLFNCQIAILKNHRIFNHRSKSNAPVSYFQWLFGLLTFFFPGAAPSVRRRMLPWHVRSGVLVYVLAILAAELGFLEKLTFLQVGGLGRYSSEALLVNFTALLVILLGSTVVIYVTAPMHSENTRVYSAVHKP